MKMNEENVFIDYQDALYKGIIGAALMIAFTVLVELMSGGHNLGAKFAKYILLGIPIWVGLSNVKNNLDNKYSFFQKGASYAAVVSFVAALIMLITYPILLPIPDITIATIPSAFADIGTTQGSTFLSIVIGVMLFFETLIMSMLTSFAILLYKYDFARTA